MEKPHRALRTLKLALTIIYLFTLTYIVFFARRRKSITRRYLNLIPIRKTISEYEVISQHSWSWYNFYSNLIGNVLLFMPMAIVIMNYGRTERRKWAIGISFLISCCIETIQYIFEIGFADIDDVILNTTGACIGASIFLYLRRKNLVKFD